MLRPHKIFTSRRISGSLAGKWSCLNIIFGNGSRCVERATSLTAFNPAMAGRSERWRRPARHCMPTWSHNFGKRFVNAPKIHFLNTNLAAQLRGNFDAAPDPSPHIWPFPGTLVGQEARPTPISGQ